MKRLLVPIPSIILTICTGQVCLAQYSHVCTPQGDVLITGASGDSYRVDLLGRWASGPCYAVAVQGNIAYIGDVGQMEVINCSVPSSPVVLGRVLLPSIAYEVTVSGTYAYVADGEDGLYILDCTEAVPVMLQSLSATWESEGVQIAWIVVDERDVSRFEIYRTGQGEAMGLPVISIPASRRERYKVTDTGASPGSTYHYTLTAIENDSRQIILGSKNVTTGAPLVLKLEQNFPNPFNPTTEIEVHLPDATRINLAVFDIKGRLVTELFSGMETAGVKHYQWDGRDHAGNRVSSGV